MASARKFPLIDYFLVLGQDAGTDSKNLDPMLRRNNRGDSRRASLSPHCSAEARRFSCAVVQPIRDLVVIESNNAKGA